MDRVLSENFYKLFTYDTSPKVSKKKIKNGGFSILVNKVRDRLRSTRGLEQGKEDEFLKRGL